MSAFIHKPIGQLVRELSKIIIPLSFASGIIPNSLWLLDNSSNKFQFATLLKFGTHYNLQILLCCACNI
jgi:hypothetical protein